MNRLKIATLIGLALLLGIAGNAANSEAVLISGTCDNLSASADFTFSGNTLTVVLTNTGANDVLVPADVLTAVFFDISGFSGTLTPVSAMLSGGSTVLFGDANGGNVGGEWAYADNLSGAPNGATTGISSSGFGLFGDNNFNGPNLSGPNAVDGLQYGITSAGDDPTTGNQAVTGTNELIKNQVTFTLTSDQAFLGNETLANVSFQYGTSLEEPNCTPGGPPTVPEPSTMLLLGLALSGSGGVGFLRRRRKGTDQTR
jgi:hypothetical protein